jgi:uncharacterized protein
MDRLFLDANILFSAADRPQAGLLRLWKLKDVTLCSSHHAREEARINLPERAQQNRLEKLARKIQWFDAVGDLPPGVNLPAKDAPILLAAIEARATHLLTGDLRHFGAYFGKKFAGVLILLPADYLMVK